MKYLSFFITITEKDTLMLFAKKLYFWSMKYELRHEKTCFFTYAKAKAHSSTFAFSTQVVQSLFFLNLKFQASSHLVVVKPSLCPEGSFSHNPAYIAVKVSGSIQLNLPSPCWILPRVGLKLTSKIYIFLTKIWKSPSSECRIRQYTCMYVQ